MAFSGKMISRITKTTASSTHTANAIRAHNNGGFSSRGTSVNSRSLKSAGSPASGYGYSHIGQRRNRYKNDVTERDYEKVRQLRDDDYHVGYGRSSDADMPNRQEANTHNSEQGRFSNRMAGADSRFEASRVAGGRFGGASSNGASYAGKYGNTPRVSGAANATARPVPKPNFRRPS